MGLRCIWLCGIKLNGGGIRTMGTIMLLGYLNGELAGVPWVVALNLSLGCGPG